MSDPGSIGEELKGLLTQGKFLRQKFAVFFLASVRRSFLQSHFDSNNCKTWPNFC